MEPPSHGRPTSAGDDARPRCFPDPPPPPHGDADALQGDAALARRREELLWEFHKLRIRQDMIFRELADVERAMVARFTPAGHWTLQVLPPSRDYSHCRPSSVASLEEAPLCLPSRCPEHPPWCCQSTQEVRPPPVYPHVERSPSPIAMRGYPEDRRSPSKQTPAEEALVPAVANASAKPMQSALVREELTPVHKDAVAGERKADVEVGHGVQPLYGIGNQSSGQRKTAEITMVDRINEPAWQSYSYMPGGQENKTFGQKRLEFSVSTQEESRSSNDTKQQQECQRSGAREHPFSGYVELCRSPRKQTPVAENMVPAAANGSTRPTRSASLGQEVAPGHPRTISGEPMDDVENSYGVQPLHEVKNQSSRQWKVEESPTEGRMVKLLQLPQHRLAGQENKAYDENKRIEFSECTPERAASGLKRRLTEATPPVKKPKPPDEWSCTLCQVNSSCQRNLDEHLAGRLHQSNVEALRARNKSGECKTRTAPGQWNKNLAKDGEPLSRDKENLAEYTGSRDQGEKPCSKGNLHRLAVKDRLEPAPPSPPSWTCSLCQARCTRESDYYEHLRGRRHRENTEALCAEFRSQSECRDEDAWSTADWKRAYYCEVCDMQCNSEKNLASHLAGRRHREALEGLE